MREPLATAGTGLEAMTPRSARETWSVRRMDAADLPEVLDVQHPGALLGLADDFDQSRHPFPLDEIRDRWADELEDGSVAAYVATGLDGRLLGFAARRGDELLHFGTAPETWGSAPPPFSGAGPAPR